MAKATTVDASIVNGIGITEAAKLFGVNRDLARERLSGLRPIRITGGMSYYAVKDVAEKLIDPPEGDVERILRMHPNSLPKMLSKEFWAGQRSRLDVLERQNDLWSTSAVVELASYIFKTTRMSLILISDALERETGLSHEQRAVVDRMVATCLNDLREKLVDGFENGREHSSGKSFASGEDEREEEL